MQEAGLVLATAAALWSAKVALDSLQVRQAYQ